MVGVERFELPTSCSQSRRATGLRYTPNRRLRSVFCQTFSNQYIFRKCFSAVRSTFENLWCREGEVDPYEITLGKFLHLVMIDITRFFLILFLIQPINFYQILNRKPHQIGNLVTVLVTVVVEIEM